MACLYIKKNVCYFDRSYTLLVLLSQGNPYTPPCTCHDKHDFAIRPFPPLISFKDNSFSAGAPLYTNRMIGSFEAFYSVCGLHNLLSPMFVTLFVQPISKHFSKHLMHQWQQKCIVCNKSDETFICYWLLLWT